MPKVRWPCCVLILSTCFALGDASAQTMPAAQSASASQSEREPDAIAGLDRMGTALRNLRNFSVRADVTTEDVLTTGQKVQFGGTIDIDVRRPNGFRITSVSDRQARTIYYDGRTLTVVAPRVGYYATAPAPGTIRETLHAAADRFGLEMPLADLFVWGQDQRVSDRVTSAFRVGTETIGGQTCEQYAMRQEGVDWQIWIREGTQALPCKIVITTTDDPSMPQFSALFTWRPQQSFAANTFVFTPPEDARQIQLRTASASTN